MEESEKRRERLRAMRAEAAQFDTSSNSTGVEVPTSCLSNPLTAIPSQEETSSAPRFDFYTDPMSAFSDNKRRNSHFAPSDSSASPVLRFPPPPPGIRNAEIPPQAHQFRGNYPPDQRVYHGPGFGYNPAPYRSPAGRGQFDMNYGNMGPSIEPGFSAGYNYNSQSPGPREGSFPSSGFGPMSGPSYASSQGGGQWVNNGPRPGSGYRDSPNPSRGGGRGNWHTSPSHGSGRRGGRGTNSGGHSFAADRPLGAERFYNNSMIEDPWKFLEPVIWREVEAPLSVPNSSKTWTPRSIATKKAKVSDDSNESGSQPSLAEYLAASFNEAIEEAPGPGM